MKKTLSIFLGCLCFLNNFFYFSLADLQVVEQVSLEENSQKFENNENKNDVVESGERSDGESNDGLQTDPGQNVEMDRGPEIFLSGGQNVQTGFFDNVDIVHDLLGQEDILPVVEILEMRGGLDPNIIFDDSFEDGKDYLPMGRTNFGLGTDYASDIKLKFDSSGDWIKSPEFTLTTGVIASVLTKANGSTFSGKAIFTDQDENIIFEFNDFLPNQRKNIVFEVPNTVTQIKLIYEKSVGNLGVGSFKLEYQSENLWTQIDAPKLKLTEIYFDGDENWFEISNIGNEDFSGQLTLSGNLDFTISTQISVGISKVFANSIYSMFQTGKNIEIIQDNISFGDSEIDLDLMRSGQVLDSFFVHKSWIDFMTDKGQSAEKVGNTNDWITTRTSLDRVYNMNLGIVANPGKYFTTGENMKDISQDKNGGDIYNDIGNENCDNLVPAIAVISEIYFGNDTYSPYVEIMTMDNVSEYYDYLLLSGDALTENVTFDISEINDDKFILLTDSNLWYDNGRNSVANTGFKISKTGSITLYGIFDDDLDILDIVHIGKFSNDHSIYMSSNSPTCPNIFGYEDKFSPGMTIGQSHFIQITPDPIVKYISVGGGGSCQSNENQVFNTDIWQGSEILISAIKYYGDYQILKLKNKSNLDINLREYSLQTLDGQIQTVKGNTLFAKSNMSFVGKYGLDFGQDFCVNLLKGENVIDRYCRNSLTKANEKDVENILNQMDFWRDLENDEIESGDETQDVQEVLTGKNDIVNIKNIKIIDVDYDPDGPDLDNESITLLLLTGEQVDLKEYRIQYIKDEKTFEKKIEGILSRGNQQIFKGAFNFPNSTKDKQPVIVQLIGANKNVIDSFVYNPNKITEIPSGNYEVVSVIDGDTIKISYQNQVFSIRLAGIDAPESSTLRCGKVECYGPESKKYLTNLLSGKSIFFEPENIDAYDRFVGYVFLDGENINENLVKNGFAREYSYKNKSYKYQSEFRSAENYAKTNLVGLWGNQCNGHRICPIDETKLKDSFVFDIENIIYDPDGPDNGNEEIWISMIKGFDVEFGDSFYLLVNDSKKSLKKYGGISLGETKKLKGTFNFPNNKKTIVSLSYDGEILDSYVYDSDLDKLDKERQMSTGDDILERIGEFTIVSVLPDPIGADGDREEISIFYVGSLEIVDLSGFFLQVGKTKKKLVGELESGKENLLKGAFGLPNKASCVEIGYGTKIFDKFCYGQPKPGQKFLKSNDVIEAIDSTDLKILKESKLKNIGNKVCLTYMDQVISCKNMPYSKLSEKKINQNGLYKNFFDNFEVYLKSEWKIMYYDSEIKNYFDLLNDIEKAISAGNSDFELNGKIYKTSEFGAMYESKYKKDVHDFVKQGISRILPDSVLNKYSQLKDEYGDMMR